MIPEIWSDQKRRRFYAVPPGTTFPPGDLILRSLGGEIRRVDPAVADIFLIDAAKAGTLIGAQLEDAYGQVQEAAARVGVVLPADGAKGLAALIAAPDAARERLQEIREVLADALSDAGTPEAQEDLSERFQKAADQIRAGADDPRVQAMGERLGAFLTSPKTADMISAFGARLSALGDKLAAQRAETEPAEPAEPTEP